MPLSLGGYFQRLSALFESDKCCYMPTSLRADSERGGAYSSTTCCRNLTESEAQENE